MSPWIMLLIGVLLTLGTAIFVAAEFSLVALDRPAVQRAVDAGDHKAEPVLHSLRRLSTLLSACQLGITITTLFLGFLANPAIGALLSPVLEDAGLGEQAAARTSSVLAMIIATVFSMILGEMVPKTLAVSVPLATAKVVATPMRIIATLMRPLIAVSNGSANWVLRRMGIEPQEELSAARSPAELASLVRSSVEAGTLDSGTARLVTRSLGFGEQTAADVMTPRNRATSIDRTASAEDERRAAQLRRSQGRFTRNFVVQGSAAEWAMAWMGCVRAQLHRRGLDAALVFFLHDEIIVHTPAVLGLLALPLAVAPVRSVLERARGRALIAVLGQTGRLQLALGLLWGLGLWWAGR